ATSHQGPGGAGTDRGTDAENVVPTFENPSLKTNHLLLSYLLNCESSARRPRRSRWQPPLAVSHYSWDWNITKFISPCPPGQPAALCKKPNLVTISGRAPTPQRQKVPAAWIPWNYRETLGRAS